VSRAVGAAVAVAVAVAVAMAFSADQIFQMLMGDEVESRRVFSDNSGAHNIRAARASHRASRMADLYPLLVDCPRRLCQSSVASAHLTTLSGNRISSSNAIALRVDEGPGRIK
jgi:ADP-ribosylglycohydrolase